MCKSNNSFLTLHIKVHMSVYSHLYWYLRLDSFLCSDMFKEIEESLMYDCMQHNMPANDGKREWGLKQPKMGCYSGVLVIMTIGILWKELWHLWKEETISSTLWGTKWQKNKQKKTFCPSLKRNCVSLIADSITLRNCVSLIADYITLTCSDFCDPDCWENCLI